MTHDEIVSQIELLSKVREILRDGKSRPKWRVSSRATMVSALDKCDLNRNTDIIEKLKELLDV